MKDLDLYTPSKDLFNCVTKHEDTCNENKCNSIKERYISNNDKLIIYVGSGTCGLGAGASAVYSECENLIKNKKLDAELVKVACIGICSMEPIVDIKVPGYNRISYGNVKPKEVDSIIEKTINHEIYKERVLFQFDDGFKPWPEIIFFKDHDFFKFQDRVVLNNCGIISPLSINQYLARGGYKALSKILKSNTPLEVCDQILSSGLRGRGGGGFPSGRKWKIALDTQCHQKYMICNADEGDPGAFMDRAVIEGDPHKLLEGLIIASYAIGASKAYIYIRAEYPLAIKHLEKAIADAKTLGLIGYNVLDSGFNIDIIVKKGAGAFVCGEETALIHSIEGKRGMPRPRPPFPAVSGLHDCPTVINNVETLANVPGIIANGTKWFCDKGTENSKGTKVFALSGDINRAGLVEVQMGITLRKIVFDIGAGISGGKGFKAAQIGGPSGGCLTKDHLDTQIDYESLKKVDAMMGSGGLVVMNENACMVDVAKFFMDFIMRESCGKCIPCREGTKRMYEILNNITSGRKNEFASDLSRFKGITKIKKLASVIRDTSLCGLGQTAPNPVLSTIKYFPQEYEEHIYERKCRAKVCKDLYEFVIDKQACKGCTLCASKCPTGAIVGEKKQAHYIMPSKCINCGACMSVCPFDAVIKQDKEV